MMNVKIALKYGMRKMMMSDLVKRLRMGTEVPEFELRQEAADEIERLRQEYDQLQNRTSDQYDEQQAEIERLREREKNLVQYNGELANLGLKQHQRIAKLESSNG